MSKHAAKLVSDNSLHDQLCASSNPASFASGELERTCSLEACGLQEGGVASSSEKPKHPSPFDQAAYEISVFKNPYVEAPSAYTPGRTAGASADKNTQGEIFVIGTPLGNCGDLSPRAQAVLAWVDVIFAEDTRVTSKLLAVCGIEKSVRRLDEAEMNRSLPEVLALVEEGISFAYCSDAGMPGISDPGLRLIDAAYERDIKVTVVPGPSACDTAYVAAGFNSQSFLFGGFIPRKDAERHKLLLERKSLNLVQIYYDSPFRLMDTLRVISRIYPKRRIAICRELTKRYEEVIRGYSEELYERLCKEYRSSRIKGEIVLVIDVPAEQEELEGQLDVKQQAQECAQEMAQKKASTKDIVYVLRTDFSLSRNEAYAIAQEAKQGK